MCKRVKDKLTDQHMAFVINWPAINYYLILRHGLSVSYENIFKVLGFSRAKILPDII